MKRFATRLLAGGALSAFGILEPATALAQENSEEIIVTATKREANPQDLGLAITAFSGEDLRERRIDTVSDLAGAVANVELYEPTGGGVPTVVIRGVGLQDFRINNSPTASMYVDEVYQPTVASANQGMFDLQRIEVLKGPQGGLYGRNTTGGALQVVSARPEFSGNEGYATLGFGSYGTRELEGAVNLRVSDRFALRVAGRGVRSDEGYTYNALTGEEHGAQDRWSARLGARWQPADNIDIYANIHGGADTSETPLLRTMGVWIQGDTFVPGLADGALLNYGGLAPSLALLCAPLQAGTLNNSVCANQTGQTPAALGLTDDPYASLSSSLNRLDNDWLGGVIVGTFEFGDVTFTSVTGADRLDYGRLTDWDAFTGAYEDVFYRSEIEAFSQEFRLSWTSGPVDWIAGVNYARDELVEDSSLVANLGIVPLGFGVTIVDQDYTQETTSWAGFVRADVALSERLTLVGEARYTDETKSFMGGINLPQVPFQLFFVDDEASFSDFSGKLALEFAQSDDLLWYASISRGFKSGGFYGGFATNPAALEPYDPEILLAYEAGVKSDWMNGRLRANASVFFYDYSDFQGFANFTSSGGAQIDSLTNVGDVEILGADLEFAWAPTEDFTLQLNAGLLDGEINRSDLLTPDSFAIALRPLEGQRLANQSDVSIDFFGRYEFGVGANLRASIQGGYSWRSESNFDYVFIPQEATLYHEDGYGLANFRAGIGPTSGVWELAAWVDNAFDEEYRVTARADDLGGFYELYGPPRSYGAALSMRW
jgi:iron complex outermembrane receptor protein